MGLFEESDFAGDPGVFFGFVDVLVSAEGDDPVDAGEVCGDGLSEVGPEEAEFMSLVCKDLSESAWAFFGVMLDDENAHELSFKCTKMSGNWAEL